VLEIKKLSASEIPALIDCIKRIMGEEESHNSQNFSEIKWHWQYSSLPSSNSQIFVISDGMKIFGYYHIVLYDGYSGGKSQLYAMVQDVAISKELRGQGKFRDLSDYANSFIAQHFPEVISYTFPNDKSIHTFIKYNNYKTVDTLPSWFQPINSYGIVKNKLPLGAKLISFLLDKFTAVKIRNVTGNYKIQENELTPKFSSIFKDFSSRQNLSICRDFNYLKWRFVDKPSSNHRFYSLTNEGDITACLIIKIDTILGAQCAVIMDYANCEGQENDLRKLISNIGKYIRQTQYLNIAGVYVSTSKNLKQLVGLDGYLKIPNFLNPRPLNLLYKKVDDNKYYFEDLTKWHITLSDWDVL
jgi:hypothetical protein